MTANKNGNKTAFESQLKASQSILIQHHQRKIWTDCYYFYSIITWATSETLKIQAVDSLIYTTKFT